MLNDLLKINGVTELTKAQKLQVVGGNDGCRIFVRTDQGNFWSAAVYSVERAQEYYATGGDRLYGGFSVTGYCCASCDSMMS